MLSEYVRRKPDLLGVVTGDTGRRFDPDAVRANVEPMGLRLAGQGGASEVSVHPTSAAVRAGRGTTASVIAGLRALAPADVALMCSDEAYTGPEFKLVPDVDADGVGRLLYEMRGAVAPHFDMTARRQIRALTHLRLSARNDSPACEAA